MPRYSFAPSALQAATPGLGKLAQAIVMSDRNGQDAYDKELLTQSRIGQAIASMQHSKSAAAAADARAAGDDAERAVLQSRPELFREQVANQAGTDIPTVNAFRAKMRGESPQVPMGPPTEMGDMGVGTFQAGAETTGKLAGAIKQFLPLLSNAKDLKPDDLAQADKIYRDGRLSDQIISGDLNRNTVGGAQAAVAGKDLFKADSTGLVLDQFGGGADTSNPLARATIAKRNAEAQESRAGAAKKSASIGSGGGGSGGGGGKAPSGYQWTTDPATGQPALKAIPGGPADKPAPGPKALNEGQAKALLFGSRMAIADEIMSELEKRGKLFPNIVKQGVESVPLIGGALGMAANYGATEAEQQVEQAQRDFINAVLRRESGASIAPSEFASAAKQYFPQLGDEKNPEVLKQKAAARRTAIEGMKADFGDAGMPRFLETVRGARAGRQPKPAAASTQSRNIQVTY